MRTRSPAVLVVAFGLFGLGALSARSAFADSTTCASDADCVKGWACQVTGGSGCAYACAAGQTCSPPPCATQDIKSCVPGPCKADSDCATGMVCYTTQSGCDSVPACTPGANCTTCTPTTQSSCIPRYDAPCKADADCGAGFSCMADSSGCACASAGSAPSSDGGTPSNPPPTTTCDCPAATTSSCHALPVTCTTAADCAAGWTCEAMPSVTCAISEPTQPPAKDAADGGAGLPAQDGGAAPQTQDAGVDPCPPPAPAMKMCLPPYYSLGGGTLGIATSGSGQTNGGGVTSTGTAGSTSTGAPATPTESDNGSKTSTAAGCSIAHNSSGGASALLLLALGLFGFARRRRSA
jgi:MYXO-CTERM domain-containing protein